MYYIYLPKSVKHDQHYVGYTSDLKKRLYSHNMGMNRATKRYAPWELIYYEAYQTAKAAQVREQILKSHGRTLAGLKIRAKSGRSI